ncbi:MAG TPA: lamin tail domain-containing protein [Gaiellaceae bacterium]|nr:lamin tail domain-containing protein [Gaiellaceae bacterium]
MKVAMARLVTLAAAAALAAVVALAAAPRAEAARAPCIPGAGKPLCYWTKGKVTFVADGDTLDVDVQGDGTSRPIRVRMIGINAMEMSVYSRYRDRRRGACHALEATSRLQRLVRGSRRVVRLSSQGRVSKAGRRYRRSVAVRVGGRWRDAGQILVNEGHVLWLAAGSEWAHNTRYAVGAQRAKAAGLRIWNPRYCGSDSSDAVPLRMWVNWDADGRDPQNLNGEWVRIKNQGTSALAIGGWWLRDSFLKRFTFPAGAVIPAGGAIALFVGSRGGDTNTSTHFYWGRTRPIFDNAGGPRGMGDGAYLFDRHGDIRASMMYPCRYACSDPLASALEVSAHPSRPEEVYVRNASSAAVDLEGYVVENPPYIYSFGAGTILAPGERLRLVVIGRPADDTALVKHWGKSRYILDDAGDVVRLRTQTNITIDCFSWGRGSC